MLKLSKRVEYGLLAVQEMARSRDTVVSAKDLATKFSISFTLLSKVLQQLVHAGYVRAYRGTRGGYALNVEAHTLTVANVIEAIEGRTAAIVDCQDVGEHDCSVSSCCTIREPLAVLRDRIADTFSSMTVAELVQPQVLPHVQTVQLVI
ncbi:MAG TPA: hypothetical protein DIS79_02545 [Bacteroidetes bacterium]|nr:hypothetical protein [Bacteroidota bacterium]HRK03626.1 Rrf2 family transcriptional regulator [Chlorobiota bacterium]